MSRRIEKRKSKTQIRLAASSFGLNLQWIAHHLSPAIGTYHTDVVMNDGATVIHTTVTSSGHDVVHFLQEVQEQEHDAFVIVGLDTEWRIISSQPGRRGYQVAVLQLCVGDCCLVYQIAHADYVPAELSDFLGHAGVTFVGVGIDGDVKRLLDDCGLVVANAVELRQVAADVLGRPELRLVGLKRLALEVMGVSLEKPREVTKSQWDARPLSAEQVRYACIDAFVSFDVGRRLLTDPLSV